MVRPFTKAFWVIHPRTMAGRTAIVEDAESVLRTSLLFPESSHVHRQGGRRITRQIEPKKKFVPDKLQQQAVLQNNSGTRQGDSNTD
jgi:hypothetical protein